MEQELENGEGAPGDACQCAPRGTCVCCSGSAAAWVAVWTRVRARVPVCVGVSVHT